MRIKLLSALLAVLVLVQFASADPGRNSFLVYTPSSKSELLAQFDNNAAVRDKYLRHFAMSRNDLRMYLASLRVKTLTHTGTYTVYSVPNTGEMKTHLETLKAGERVFVDQTGKPVLRARCGNPLTKGPSKPVVPNELQASVIGTPVDLKSPDDIETVTEDMVAYSPPAIPTLVDLPPTPVPPTETPVTPPTTTGERPQAFILPALLGGSALIGGNGGHTHNDVVPEPASVLAMVAGFAGLAAKRRRKK